MSLELSSVCIVYAKGKIVKETKVGSDPDSLIAFLRGPAMPIDRIGLEAGPLSQWLHAGLTKAGFETVLLETRHVKAALSAMSVNALRAHLSEFGIIAAKGIGRVDELLDLAENDATLPVAAEAGGKVLASALDGIDKAIDDLEGEITSAHAQRPAKASALGCLRRRKEAARLLKANTGKGDLQV
ncbi:transposase [Rhodoblastus sphagnicola]|nr:transposase [Rhodoblastus sphagnicola]